MLLVISHFGCVLNLLHNVIALEDFAEDNVTAIEPRSDGSGDEELRAVGVFAGVCLSTSISMLPISHSLTCTLTIDSCPFLLCFNLKFSSGNLSP